jgi:hypothetical protein
VAGVPDEESVFEKTALFLQLQRVGGRVAFCVEGGEVACEDCDVGEDGEECGVEFEGAEEAEGVLGSWVLAGGGDVVFLGLAG